MTSDEKPQSQYPPRPPRVYVDALQRISLNLVQPAQIQGIKLSNISITGVGIMRGENIPWPAKGEVVSAHLMLDNRGFPVKIRMVHVSSEVVGGVFVEDPRLPMIQTAIRGFFSVELAALLTMKVNPKYHKSEPDGEAHWIRGDNTELYYVTSGDRVLRFRLSILGNHFHGGENLPLTLGQVIQGESDGHSMVKSSELMAETKASPELMELGQKFLKNIPHLLVPHRREILKAFSSSIGS